MVGSRLPGLLAEWVYQQYNRAEVVDMSGFDPTLVSNNILQRAFRDNVPVSPMKLQKILYFAASEYAKKVGKPLLNDDFEAWQYGPVVRDVFQEFKSFSGKPIRAYAKDAAGQSFIISETDNPVFSDVLDRVWAQTRGRTAVSLSRLTHVDGSAWHSAYTGWNDTISNEAIQADCTYREALSLG